MPVLSNKDVQEKLRPHLPEGYSFPKNESEYRDTIQSPQFRQAVSAFRFVPLVTDQHHTSSPFQSCTSIGPIRSYFGPIQFS